MTEETAILTTTTTSSSVACKMNRMILEMKLNENDTQFEYEDDIINYFDDDEVVVVVVEDENEDEDELELKTRNSSTSDSGCSSSTSFNDKPSATNLVKSTRSILSGISGRAKYDDEQPKHLILNKMFNSISIQTVNYGDDCGFICNKHIQSNKSRLMHNNNNNNNDGDYDDNKQLINKYYFGLADGVSANRLRGYDAKLFPTALLNACTFYIDKLAASSVLQFVKTSFNSDIEIMSAKKEEEVKDEEEEEEEDEDDWNDEDWNVQPSVEIVEEVVENEIEENDCANLNNILINAHNLVQEQQVYGSSTVCLFSLEFYDMHEYGLLSTCNLGDSGYMLIRNSKVMFKSQTQSHRYNAPYQLGCTPPELLDHDLYRDK